MLLFLTAMMVDAYRHRPGVLAVDAEISASLTSNEEGFMLTA